jgi:hypothetical protein
MNGFYNKEPVNVKNKVRNTVRNPWSSTRSGRRRSKPIQRKSLSGRDPNHSQTHTLKRCGDLTLG